MFENLIRFRKDLKLVLVDFETQNLCLNEFHNLPWQVALLETNSQKIINSYDAYIKWNPLLRISADAARITGYRQSVVEERGQDPLLVAQKVYDSLKSADYIVGHNVLGFDYYVANSFFRKVGLGSYHFIDKLIDTNCLIRGLKTGYLFKPGLDNLVEYQYKMFHHRVKGVKTSLGVVAKEYGIVIDETRLHDATYDLQLNFEVFKKVIFQVEI